MYIFEVVFVLAVILYVLAGSKDRYLYVLVFFLPFNAFIKSYLDFVGMDSRLFGFWKEILIAMFFVGSFNQILKHGKLKPISIFLSAYILLFFVLGCTLDVSSAFVKLRDYLFPIILLVTVSSRNYTSKTISNLLIVFSVSILITCFAGFLETFGGLRPQIAIIKNALIGIDPSTGTIYYPAAWMIMGRNRMVGLMDSPNQLGVLLAAYLIVSYFFRSFLYSNKRKKFVVIVGIIASICLILTFSRTAFGLLVITYFFYMFLNINNKRNFKRSIYIILGVIVIFAVIFALSESLQEVVMGTATGQEASSADRSNNVMSGLQYIMSHPLGLGLGATKSVNGEATVVFFESGMINLTIEQGIGGFILLIIYFEKIYNYIKKISRNTNLNNFRFIFIATFICSCVSINPLEFIYTYYLMIFTGLIISNHITYKNIR